MSLNWNFQRGGGGVKTKIPLWGEYGYFLEQHNPPNNFTLRCLQNSCTARFQIISFPQGYGFHSMGGPKHWPLVSARTLRTTWLRMVGKNRSEKLEILHRLQAVLFLICSGIVEHEDDVFEKFHAREKVSCGRPHSL